MDSELGGRFDTIDDSLLCLQLEMSDSDDDDIMWEDCDGAGVENAVNVLAEEDLEIDMSEGGDVDDTLDNGKDVGKKGKDKKKYFPAEMWCHIEAAERFRGGLKRILKSVKKSRNHFYRVTGKLCTNAHQRS